MSFGPRFRSEAHETIAIAMNRIGGRSEHGRGRGKTRRAILARCRTAICGAARSSRWLQGRFGVTAHYLVNADELQIKMAQGAKPGESGQLPGHKVDEVIARVSGIPKARRGADLRRRRITIFIPSKIWRS